MNFTIEFTFNCGKRKIQKNSSLRLRHKKQIRSKTIMQAGQWKTYRPQNELLNWNINILNKQCRYNLESTLWILSTSQSYLDCVNSEAEYWVNIIFRSYTSRYQIKRDLIKPNLPIKFNWIENDWTKFEQQSYSNRKSNKKSNRESISETKCTSNRIERNSMQYNRNNSSSKFV